MATITKPFYNYYVSLNKYLRFIFTFTVDISLQQRMVGRNGKKGINAQKKSTIKGKKNRNQTH